MDFSGSEESGRSAALSPLFNKNDKSFVYSINNFIEQEMGVLEASVGLREKYLVHKAAFNKVVNYVQVYKALLTNIKKEYEFCISELENNQTEFDESQDEIIRLEGSAQTLCNVKARLAELNRKAEMLREENERLRGNLERLLAENAKYRPNESDDILTSRKALTKEQFAYFKERSQLAGDERPKGPLKGLSLERSTDVDYLNEVLDDLELKIYEITTTQAKKYATKAHKHELEKVLFAKMAQRDSAIEETVSIRNNMQLYRLAVDLATEYYKGNTKYTSIGDALSRGLVDVYLTKQKLRMDEDDNECQSKAGLDDLNLEKESEFILEYLENFNELFDSEKYVQAAYYAAASPKNILRNLETLLKFKRVSGGGGGGGESSHVEYSEETNPLLVYCMSVIDSINDEASKPDADMSVECIRVVLKYNNIDILTRLIAQRRITFSYAAAQLIEEYALLRPKNSKSLFELVLYIYKDIEAAFEAAVCMAKLGRFSAMMDFIRSSRELTDSSPEIFFRILAECPSIELACEIMDNSTQPTGSDLKIPIDRIVSILLDSDQPENGLKFLKVQIQKNALRAAEDNGEQLRKLKVSYETLVKFSFLTTEEEEFTKSIARETRDHYYDIMLNNQKSDLKPGSDSAAASSCQDSKPAGAAGVSSLQKKRSTFKDMRLSQNSKSFEEEPDAAEAGKSRPVQARSALRSHINMGEALVEEEEED